jgi:hypothetical protein
MIEMPCGNIVFTNLFGSSAAMFELKIGGVLFHDGGSQTMLTRPLSFF